MNNHTSSTSVSAGNSATGEPGQGQEGTGASMSRPSPSASASASVPAEERRVSETNGAELVVATRGEGPGGAGAEREATGAAVGQFAAVSALQALALALTPAQRTAIEKLTGGHSLAESALAAGVNRTTLYRWLKNDAEFAAAYNAWQQDAIATARGRLLALTDTAVTAVGKAMQRGDGRLALKVLERIGIAERAKPGAADAEELKREQAMERRKLEAERKSDESMLRLSEMIAQSGIERVEGRRVGGLVKRLDSGVEGG